jgi:hypothetical protein
MKIKFFFLSFFVLNTLAGYAQPLSGSYTVGGANPSFTSIRAAVDSLVAKGVSGPVIIRIRTGIYNERISITPVTGTSPVNTITFRSESGNADDVIITHPGGNANTDHHVIRLDGADHIVIEKLSIQNTGINYGTGINLVSRADSNIIRNCKIRVDSVYAYPKLNINANLGYANFMGILVSDTSAIHGQGKHRGGNYNLFMENEVRGSYGIVIKGGGYPDSVNTIQNNKLWTSLLPVTSCGPSAARQK